MKSRYAIGLVVVAVLIAVAVQVSRMDETRREAQSDGESKPVAAADVAPEGEASGPARTKSRTERKPESPEEPADSGEEPSAKTVRKMGDQPAGESTTNQGLKMVVSFLYKDFIEGLDLTAEEADYFKVLLGKEMADQQELVMRMAGSSEEERQAIVEEMNRRTEANNGNIEEFLNSSGDYQKYTAYKDRLPERQQIDGIRNAMVRKGVPLDEESATRLMEAMHRVRTESGAPDFSGPGAMGELAKEGFVETFERSWKAKQEALRSEVSDILSPDQMEAFQEYQKQRMNVQLTSLKATEKKILEPKESSE